MHRLHHHLSGPPRTWQKPVYAILPLVVAIPLYGRRGWAVSLAAVLFYGALAAGSVLAWDRLRAWSTKHPALDSACLGLFLFFALAYLPVLPTTMCVVIGAGGAVVGVSLHKVLRTRRAANRAAPR